MKKTLILCSFSLLLVLSCNNKLQYGIIDGSYSFLFWKGGTFESVSFKNGYLSITMQWNNAGNHIEYYYYIDTDTLKSIKIYTNGENQNSFSIIKIISNLPIPIPYLYFFTAEDTIFDEYTFVENATILSIPKSKRYTSFRIKTFCTLSQLYKIDMADTITIKAEFWLDSVKVLNRISIEDSLYIKKKIHNANWYIPANVTYKEKRYRNTTILTPE